MSSRVDAPDIMLPTTDQPTGRKWSFPTPLRWLVAVLVMVATVIAIASRFLPPTTDTAPPILTTKLPPLFDDIEERTFRYFWDTADPKTGLVPDRYPTPSFVEHRGGRIRAHRLPDRRRARLRHARRGARARAHNVALLSLGAAGRERHRRGGLQGLLLPLPRHEDGPAIGTDRVVDRRHGAASRRRALRPVLFRRRPTRRKPRSARLADEIYRRVDWRWAQARPPAISPRLVAGIRDSSSTTGCGYNEAMLVYILALGSPTHPVEPTAWEEWRRGYEHYWGELYGQPHLTFTPLFGHQYSHVWIDFRGIVDGPHAQRRPRLLRELPARDLCAARLCDRKSACAGRATARTCGD